MSQILLLRNIVRSLPRVASSRLLRGPARPSWSFGFELVIEGMRRSATTIADRSWVDHRLAYDRLGGYYSPKLRLVRREKVTMGGVPCEWFVPKSLASRAGVRVVLYLHGGAYIFGSTRSHAELIAGIGLASAARVLAPNYRLAPENPFPAGIDDVVAVYRALVASGVAPRNIVVGGDSAGGGLTLALLQRLRAANEEMPSRAFLVCPWVDLTADGGSLLENESFDWGSSAIARKWSQAYLGGHDPHDPLVSPAHADLSGLPPLLVQVGEAELIRDQVLHFARRAKDAGVDVELVVEPDQVHDWHSFAGVFKGCGRAITEIGEFVRTGSSRAS